MDLLKKLLLPLIVLGIFSFSAFISYSYIKKLQDENKRLEYNIENANFKLDSVRTINGELLVSTNSLIIERKELQKYNSELNNVLKEFGIAVKNLQSVSKINLEYTKRFTDSIVSVPVIQDKNEPVKTENKKFKFNSKDIYSEIYGEINIPKDYPTNYPFITNAGFNTTDEIIVANEYIYKGWWFWKKVKEIKIHIKGKNPALKIDTVQSFQIKSKQNITN